MNKPTEPPKPIRRTDTPRETDIPTPQNIDTLIDIFNFWNGISDTKDYKPLFPHIEVEIL